jgi:hypothetical protein
MSLTIIIIDKFGELKTLNVKNYCEDELYKKCGFKRNANFILQTTWDLTMNDVNYSISMYGKTDGKKNFKNVCCFPHPLNNTIFYGSCALVGSSNGTNINLSVDLWKQIQTYLMNTVSLNFNGKSSHTFSVSNTPTKPPHQKKDKNKDKNVEIILTSNQSPNISEKELEEEDYYYSSDDEIN